MGSGWEKSGNEARIGDGRVHISTVGVSVRRQAKGVFSGAVWCVCVWSRMPQNTCQLENAKSIVLWHIFAYSPT